MRFFLKKLSLVSLLSQNFIDRPSREFRLQNRYNLRNLE